MAKAVRSCAQRMTLFRSLHSTRTTHSLSKRSIHDSRDGTDPKEKVGDPVDARYTGQYRPLVVKKYGLDILHDPLWNKGTAHPQGERDRLGLRGLVPPRIVPFHVQGKRVMRILRSLNTDFEKNLYLQELHNHNETLYHRLLIDNIEELAPLVYTPVVGQVCLEFGDRFLRARGMYFSMEDRGHFSSMIYNWPQREVHVVVVTDGSRILGLGDLGAHGMGIPIGKLALYVAAGGIAPHRVLPVTLDAGTNNEEHLTDENYLGIQKPRLTGHEYYEMVDEFMRAVYQRYPNVLVQFEDFSSDKALPLLDKYRNECLMFNDDIQGTGAVTLAGLLSACEAKGEALKDQRIVVVGAGSSGLGVAQQILDGMVMQGATPEEARSQFYVVSSVGLIGRATGKYGDKNQTRGLAEDRVPWVRSDLDDAMPLDELVATVQPTVLLGLSTTPNIFTEEIVRTMHASCKEPIIFPMSNPTSKSECTAEQAYEWTNGQCIFAAGSPFGEVDVKGRGILKPSQCNNMFIFPGLGLGATICAAEKITDAMLYRAAEALSKMTTPEERASGLTFPPVRRIRDVSLGVACAVIQEAQAEGLTKMTLRGEALRKAVRKKMYDPVYTPLIDPKYETRAKTRVL